MTSDLIARLRKTPCDIGGDHPDLHEQAADAMEATKKREAEKEAAIVRLIEQQRELQAELEAAQDEIERLYRGWSHIKVCNDPSGASGCEHCHKIATDALNDQAAP